MAEKWMQDAVKRKGALTRKAKAAGMSPMAFARSHAHATGLTGRQARFALNAQGEKIPAKPDETGRRADRRYHGMR